MSIEEQHVALPKLYGAPAYGRPPRPVDSVERPFDPDELPIEAYRTGEEQEFLATLPARAYAPGADELGLNGTGSNGHKPSLRPGSLSLRRMAGKLLGGE